MPEQACENSPYFQVGMGKGRWSSQRDLKEVIKETFFDMELLDPSSYDKHNTVDDSKERQATFLSVQDKEFLTIFRHAASKYTLQEDYDNTKN